MYQYRFLCFYFFEMKAYIFNCETEYFFENFYIFQNPIFEI